MANTRRTSLIASLVSIIAIVGLVGWFLTRVFESECPRIQMGPLPQFLSERQEIPITIVDTGSGIRRVQVTIRQAGRVIPVFERTFDFRGFLNHQGTHEVVTRLPIDPSLLNLGEGYADLSISVWDYSRTNDGEGNLGRSDGRMTVDTIPPAVTVVAGQNYVTQGGSGLVLYQTSSDAVRSGLFVGDICFPGFPAQERDGEGIWVCYFTVPLDLGKPPDIYLWAEDGAGNGSKAVLPCHLGERRFRADRIDITDSFLEQVLPRFSSYLKEKGGDGILDYLRINRDLRRENGEALSRLARQTDPRMLWDGKWLKPGNMAEMARFGDRRIYYYKGARVDEQTHMGVDLASPAKPEVRAANSGRVVFAGEMGIYGLTVVIDHGQGLASLYSHLKEYGVKEGDHIHKGDLVGMMGQTGLAVGDHLHFGLMVNGLFVNPIEWWDGQWIKDNILRKLGRLKK